jgi:hypothetical protein
MTQMRFFVEYHFGRRQPNLEFWLNGQKLLVQTEWSQSPSLGQVNAILTAHADLADHNVLEIWQRDKTDQDLVQHDNTWIDHWCKIQEIEIGGIPCQTALYICTEFEHAMSDEWVANMQSQGHAIPKIYKPGGTDIRLNGCCRLTFSTPVWQWYINNYEHTN